MGKAWVVVCSNKHELAVWCLWVVVLPLLFGSITLGSIFACYYVKENHLRNSYINASCLLLDYGFNEQSCQKCDGSCYTYTCFTEKFSVSYEYLNRTTVTTHIITHDFDSKHIQTQIGKNYQCFYQKDNSTVVVWNLPDNKINLSTLIIAYIIATVFILLLVIVLWRQKTNKYSKIDPIVLDAPKYIEATLVE